MAKYEIMLLISNTVDEPKANQIYSDLKALLKVEDIKEEKLGSQELAYKIKKCDHAFYYIMKFESDSPENINEFKRLTLINKNVLRHLIINIEKDYGYRASINPKKIAKSEFKSELYTTKKAEHDKYREQRQAEYLARKEQWLAEKNNYTQVRETVKSTSNE